MPQGHAANRCVMRASLAAALAAASVLALLPASPRPAVAATGVLRCEAPDGTRIYTSKACSSFGASTSRLSPDLLNRIAAQRRHEVRVTARRNGNEPAEVLAAPDDGRLAALLPARRPAADGCARSPRQLALDVRASVAMGDVNRVAESFHWAGMRHDQAQRIMDRLDRMAGLAMVDAEYFDVALGAATFEPEHAGVMQLAFREDGRMSFDEFEVSRDSSCYFLRYA